jgi:hypothetical protein
MKRSEIEFTVDRSRIDYYYGTYQYKVSFDVKGIGYFRYVSSYDKFERVIDEPSNNYRGIGIWPRKNRAVTLREQLEPTLDVIREFVLWRQWAAAENHQFRVSVSHNYVTVYLNDLDLVGDLTDRFGQHVRISYYRVDRLPGIQPDVIYQHSPKHKYRFYFKEKSYRSRPEEFVDLIEFLKNNEFEVCRTLLAQYEVFKNPDSDFYSIFRFNPTYITRDRYADFDDDRMLTILSLRFPDALRKVFRIEGR